jgi:hypothetical protein
MGGPTSSPKVADLCLVSLQVPEPDRCLCPAPRAHDLLYLESRVKEKWGWGGLYLFSSPRPNLSDHLLVLSSVFFMDTQWRLMENTLRMNVYSPWV